jgi:hypothetical protein
LRYRQARPSFGFLVGKRLPIDRTRENLITNSGIRSVVTLPHAARQFRAGVGDPVGWSVAREAVPNG